MYMYVTYIYFSLRYTIHESFHFNNMGINTLHKVQTQVFEMSNFDNRCHLREIDVIILVNL